MAAGRGKDGGEKGSNRFEFTDKGLRGKRITPAPQGRRKFFWDTNLPGLALRVGDTITKDRIGRFYFVGRFPGKKSSSAREVGDFPGMKVADARDVARAMKEAIRRGVDPKEEAAERRRAEEKRRASTFAAAVEDYAKEKLALLSSGPGVHSDLKRHAVKAWGDRPITDIREDDVEALIKKLKGEVGPGASDKQLSHLKTLFKWAVKKRLIQTSPAASVESLSKKIERDRVLSSAEILAFWRACDKLGGPFAQCFKFLLATAARRTEAGAMQWSELDLEARLWALPRARSKSGRAHSVPLSELAMSILADRPRLGPFVFSTTDGQTAISGWSKAKARLDKIVADEMRAIAAERGDEAAAVPQWGLHDLRRTAATGMSRLGAGRVTISKVLNHAEGGGATKIYDRHSFDREKRAALEAWGRHLSTIIAGTPGNVIALSAALR
jgi:integrase